MLCYVCVHLSCVLLCCRNADTPDSVFATPPDKPSHPATADNPPSLPAKGAPPPLPAKQRSYSGVYDNASFTDGGGDVSAMATSVTQCQSCVSQQVTVQQSVTSVNYTDSGDCVSSRTCSRAVSGGVHILANTGPPGDPQPCSKDTTPRGSHTLADGTVRLSQYDNCAAKSSSSAVAGGHVTRSEKMTDQFSDFSQKINALTSSIDKQSSGEDIYDNVTTEVPPPLPAKTSPSPGPNSLSPALALRLRIPSHYDNTTESADSLPPPLPPHNLSGSRSDPLAVGRVTRDSTSPSRYADIIRPSSSAHSLEYRARTTSAQVYRSTQMNFTHEVIGATENLSLTNGSGLPVPPPLPPKKKHGTYVT